jgi:dolichyl-phosphate beta-glucosyltransferase
MSSRMSDAPRPPNDEAGVALSVIVPAFNEVDGIGQTVSRILAFLDTRPYSSELIVVLDGGRPGADRAAAAAAGGRSNVHVLDNVRNRGKGFSVRRGIQASKGRAVLFVDADLSLPIEDADRFVAALDAGADVAIGSRALSESRETGEQQPLRQSFSRLFNWLVRTTAVPDLHDTQCGFKAFRGASARALFAVQRIDGFGFDVEVLRVARRWSYRIVEVPVRCEYHPTSSVRKFRHGFTMILDVVRILSNDARGRYARP